MGYMILMMLMVIILFAVLVPARRRREAPGRLEELRDAGRLERIESALVALEARLEELSDQQRFLERLLADRPPSRALPGGEPRSEGLEGEDPPDSILFDREPDGSD